MWISAKENKKPGEEAGTKFFLLEYSLDNKDVSRNFMSVAHLDHIYDRVPETYFKTDKETGEKKELKREKKIYRESLWMVDNWYVHKQGYRVVAWKEIQFSGFE